jgi:hypothetical protein
MQTIKVKIVIIRIIAKSKATWIKLFRIIV